MMNFSAFQSDAPSIGKAEGMNESDEQGFRAWLEANAADVLREAGVCEGQTVLDYGCGSGTFSIPAASIVGERGKVYALDIDGDALAKVSETAKSKGLGNINTLHVDKAAPASGLVPEAVDTALLYDVIQLVDDRPALLAELAKVIKPDGILSVFPMHIGTDEMLRLADELGLLTLRDRKGMLLNFSVSTASSGLTD